MSKEPINLSRVTLAAHLILTGYGHWFPNDLRRSGSDEVRKGELKDLAPIHFGRKRNQPSRDELREFFHEGEPRLDHPVLWFDDRMRESIASAFAQVVQENGYTCWACAILRDHAHLVIRAQRHKCDAMLGNLANRSRELLLASQLIPDGHPVWASRPYRVLLFTKEGVFTRIVYVENNPVKHRVHPVPCPFVVPCPWK